MKIEIKFRCWCREGNCNDEDDRPEFTMIDSDSLTILYSIPLKDTLKDIEDVQYYMQFTGLIDKEGIEIYQDDLRIDEDSVIFRIYKTYGGFVVKANYWKSDIKDLIPSDELILMTLSDAQTAQWLKNSTKHYGNIYEN